MHLRACLSLEQNRSEGNQSNFCLLFLSNLSRTCFNIDAKVFLRHGDVIITRKMGNQKEGLAQKNNTPPPPGRPTENNDLISLISCYCYPHSFVNSNVDVLEIVTKQISWNTNLNLSRAH